MIEINNKADYNLDVEKIREATQKFLRHFQKEEQNVSLALVTDEEIQKLNNTYRGLDKPTDVLSFPEEEGNDFLGEIIIDHDQIARQAPYFSQTREQELIFILIHGLLHLLGYSDYIERDKQDMIQLGEKLIKELNL